MKKRKAAWISLILAGLVTVAILTPGLAASGMRQTDFGDPVGNYNFKLEIEGVSAGQFTSVDGLSIEQEVIEYQNGDDPLTRKRPGRVSYSNLTLTRNYTMTSVLNDWIESARLANGEYTRKNISLVLIDQTGRELKRWNCFECFPASWKLNTLDGKGNDVLTEEIVIVIEYFEEA